MKTIRLACRIITALFFAGAFFGCATPPAQRVVSVQTLKTIGQSAEATVTLSAQLYAAGKITAPQAREVFDFYNGKFQPAFRLAVAAVRTARSSVPVMLTVTVVEAPSLVATLNVSV